MTDAPDKLTVPAESAGQRLDQFLASALQRSRAEVQRKIAAGQIAVNGRPAAKDFRLEIGSVISFAPDTPAAQAAPPPAPIIVAEDESVLIFNKPSGLTMHAGPGVRGETLAD